MVLENQADIFSIFHDGSFTKFIKNQSDVEFIIEIEYLAELINPMFSLFKGKLKNCTKLEYHVWGEEHRIIDNLSTLGALDLEVLYAEVKGNYIEAKCFDDENCGGDLVIVTDDIIIFDENNQEVLLNKLVEICKSYWNSKHKQ
ncbi:hypothetical protein [Clostridium sp. OS1-26]|uniref:hypothetical protein n=1 Tax=Clostridium sp. OS1-26 TaxID=3070681 RepID=UPI0027DF0C39|nr:hypothetical protein [Clostridium sp. OS1-26]WML34972.1 hypothetical protein RCG18_27660 [Clostridium sp. OS1-26]